MRYSPMEDSEHANSSFIELDFEGPEWSLDFPQTIILIVSLVIIGLAAYIQTAMLVDTSLVVRTAEHVVEFIRISGNSWEMVVLGDEPKMVQDVKMLEILNVVGDRRQRARS